VTGQPSILYYAAGIFKDAGIDSYAAVLTGAFQLIMTLLSVVVVDKYGRRWLLFVGISVMLVALAILILAFHGYEPVGELAGDNDTEFQPGDIDGDDQDSAGCCAASDFTPRTAMIVLGMFSFIGGYQVSFGPIAWLLISEVFAMDVRDAAIAVAVQTNFFWNLVVSFGYPTLVAGKNAPDYDLAFGSLSLCSSVGVVNRALLACITLLSPLNDSNLEMGALFGDRDQYAAAFGLFFALTAYSLFFVHRYVPETKGLSLLQIEALLQGG
jgi:MFS family permease